MKTRTITFYLPLVAVLCFVAQLMGLLFPTQASVPTDATVPTASAQAGEWQFIGTTQWDLPKGPAVSGDGSLGIRSFQFDERGGDVEATVTMAQFACSQGTAEVETIRFKWTFTAPILRLRPGDLIPITVETVGGKSQKCPYAGIGRSSVYVRGSDLFLVPADQQNLYTSEFMGAPGRIPAGVRYNFTPDGERDRGQAVLQFSESTPGPTGRKRSFFAIRFDTNATRGGGAGMTFAYMYEFGAAGRKPEDSAKTGGGGAGASAAMRACLMDPGAMRTDRRAHYDWASRQSPETLARDLANKTGLLFNCNSLDDTVLHALYADLSVLIATYVPDANCFGGDRGIVTTDRSAHYNWARGRRRDQLRDGLIWKLQVALRCLSRDRQNDFHADASVIMAGGN